MFQWIIINYISFFMLATLNILNCFIPTKTTFILFIVSSPSPSYEDLCVCMHLQQHVSEKLRIRIQLAMDEFPLILAEGQESFQLSLNLHGCPRLPLV